jgi:ROK family
MTQYDSIKIELGDAADVFVRAGEGDEGAQTILNETAEGLSILCINICRILDPEFIIIGGGMSLAGDVLLEPIKKYFRSRSWTVLNDDVSIVIASNSNDAGIIGAALHAMTCFIRTRDDLAFETMILNSSPRTSSIIKASKSVEVLNYMHSNRESGSNKDLSDCVSRCIGDEVILDSRATVNGNRYNVHASQPTLETEVSSSDPNSKEHIESDNSIDHNSSSRILTMTLLVSGALSLFSAYTFGATVTGNRNIEYIRNDNKAANVIHYSAFFCQICAGSYLLYQSQKHTF